MVDSRRTPGTSGIPVSEDRQISRADSFPGGFSKIPVATPMPEEAITLMLEKPNFGGIN